MYTVHRICLFYICIGTGTDFKSALQLRGANPFVQFNFVRCMLFQQLTISPPIQLRLYTLPYWSNPPFLIFDIRALWRSGLSARAPECQKLKMVG